MRSVPPVAAALLAVLLIVPALSPDATAQWTNRYPKVEGYGHHVYLEGFELPLLTSGPMDPAPSPDGEHVAIAVRGWIWLLDPESGVATQLTTGPGVDSRPAWSPDGSRLAFVRDDSEDTDLVVRSMTDGTEETVVSTDAIDLDPRFGPDGTSLYYVSADSGSIDLWRADLSNGTRTRLTTSGQLARTPIPTPDGSAVVFVEKTTGTAPDEIVHLALNEDGTPGERTVLAKEHIASQADLTLAPDGRTLAYTWPHESGFELRLLATDGPTSSVRLAGDETRPLAPAFSADGTHVWFAVPTENESTALRRVPTAGGPVEDITVRAWEWQQEPGTVRIRSRIDGETAPARLSVTDGSGHPAVPDAGMIRFDGSTGRVFYYSPGVMQVTVPPGETTVSAVQGLTTPEATATVRVESGETTEVVLDLSPVWNAGGAGWASADHHFHLNYGGPYVLAPSDLQADMRGENLDIGSPLLANLHDRFLDQHLWGYEDDPEPPIIEFGQEIRSHFLGHLKLLGTDDLFWPWVWGPYYQVYGDDDRTNAQALKHAHQQGALGGYVHPVVVRDAFTEKGARTVPIELVADAVLGHVDLIEVGCMWTDEIGTAGLWHRLLSLGLPTRASAGSDVMNNYYRTMAVGATRVYVRHDGSVSYDTHLEGLREGRSFVTNGPMLDVQINEARPGEVVDPGPAQWSLDLHSAVPVDSVTVFVNGNAAWTGTGLDTAGSRTYDGQLNLPDGGWVTVRAHGGESRWPMMDSYPFAETNPIWIGAIGSTDPDARQAAARDLLQVLNASEERLHRGYGDTPIPALTRHFDEARETLNRHIRE